MTNSKENFVDMSVKLKGTSSMRQMPKDYTTALEMALMFDGRELEAEGYKRAPIELGKLRFQPNTGNILVDVSDLQFGSLSKEAAADGLAVMALDAIVFTQATTKALTLPPNVPIKLNNVRLLQIPVVK